MALRSHSLLIKSPCIFSATADFVFQALINRAPGPAAGAGVREPVSRRAVRAPSAAAGVGPVGGAAPPQAAGRRRRMLLIWICKYFGQLFPVTSNVLLVVTFLR